MRPDEHKQKKSAQYQKKHNKKGANPKQKGAAGDSKSEAPKSKTTRSRDSVGRAKHDKNPKTLAASDSDTSDSDAEVPTQRKTFQRRTIVSNWDKYELAPDKDDDVVKRGDDFTQLLSSAGGALSQFRFKDEEEWEEEGTASESDFLAVDCDELASSLACLPVHETLGLEKAIFSEKQISQMNSDAAANKELYKPPEKRAAQKGVTVSASLLTEPDESELVKDSEMSELSQVNKDLNVTLDNLKLKSKDIDEVSSLSEEEKVKSERTSAEKSKTKQENNSDINNAENTKETQKKHEPVDQDDEELDFLLSMDNPQAAVEPEVAEVSKDKGKERKRDVTDCFVGGMTFTDTTTTWSASPRVNKREGTKSTQSKDLDDWLDRVVND